MLIETIIGIINTNWAIIIIVGVYKISKNPKGPDLEKIRYNTKPTKTGGNPIKELIKIIKTFFPKKFFITHNAAIGNPIKHEKKSEVKETFKDKKIISNKSLSAFKIKIIESDKI
tara:strand:+ start:1629 stop:1973 length:345 start_codon:yes stop_codon:yes gene_type:complete